ncbi:TKL protein kinase [Thecamonas trahens ATCC 50062]|uniref:TKL protein kinase n=1 Tax=Thecamonas trahens ATCC 50062 TaxID=461836 RepID=A0A0L0DUU5_THETB|nr:TKL protein kinase [Thecamonas trahens ATCC 50062]KNC56005.1 TKL protein kinase [Thecamonas trahens ATCC 50062]|eukprot:XP_013761051.1 TKL protein kinase [Thecamonas trahens ATCC 50062]
MAEEDEGLVLDTLFFATSKVNGWAFLSSAWPQVPEKAAAAVAAVFPDVARCRIAITLGGARYSSALHYFQATKYDTVPAVQILLRDAAEAGTLAAAARQLRRERPLSEAQQAAWKLRRVNVMRDGLLALYVQHPPLAAALLSSAPRPLAKSPFRSESFWSGGSPSSANVMGETLMWIRLVLGGTPVPPMASAAARVPLAVPTLPPARALSDAQRAAFRTQGHVVVSDVLPRAAKATVEAHFQLYLDFLASRSGSNALSIFDFATPGSVVSRAALATLGGLHDPGQRAAFFSDDDSVLFYDGVRKVRQPLTIGERSSGIVYVHGLTTPLMWVPEVLDPICDAYGVAEPGELRLANECFLLKLQSSAKVAPHMDVPPFDPRHTLADRVAAYYVVRPITFRILPWIHAPWLTKLWRRLFHPYLGVEGARWPPGALRSNPLFWMDKSTKYPFDLALLTAYVIAYAHAWTGTPVDVLAAECGVARLAPDHKVGDKAQLDFGQLLEHADALARSSDAVQIPPTPELMPVGGYAWVTLSANDGDLVLFSTPLAGVRADDLAAFVVPVSAWRHDDVASPTPPPAWPGDPRTFWTTHGDGTRFPAFERAFALFAEAQFRTAGFELPIPWSDLRHDGAYFDPVVPCPQAAAMLGLPPGATSVTMGATPDAPLAKWTVDQVVAWCVGQPELAIHVDAIRAAKLDGAAVEALSTSELARGASIPLGVAARIRRELAGVGPSSARSSSSDGELKDVDFGASAGAAQLDFGELVIGDQIGSGAFGVVYVGSWRGADVAVKRLRAAVDGRHMAAFLREVATMHGLKAHPNIVLFLGMSGVVLPTGIRELYLVTEYCSGGSLDKLVFDGQVTIPANRMFQIALEVASGMMHIHSEGLVHRDLALRNLLVTGRGSIKVADFGLSKTVLAEASSVGEATSSTFVGPLKAMAPESLRGNHGPPADVWAFGIAMWELVTRTPVFADLTAPQVAAGVLAAGLRPPIGESMPRLWANMLQACWAEVPTARPTFADIISVLSPN